MSTAAPALQPSELVLGRYRPLRPLGTGGSGSVWLARDEENGLDVALKIVPREGKAAQRAEREAAAAARLRHPSCLRAYACARDSRHVYIAYQYVPGCTFREAMRAGELNDARAIEAGAQVCEGLAHAHAAGILHRDVKPSNVLLAEEADVSVRLLDFGLARMQGGETLTAQGDVPGTLAYISPERLAGEPATEAADVWAVGVMLWEALAGSHPFWNGSMLDTARAIEAGAESLAALRPDLPKPLVAAVDRALDLDPRRRPAARELADALRTGGSRRRAQPRVPRPGALVDERGLATAGAAGLAACFAGWFALALPFFPAGWWAGIALLAAGAAALRPRLGLAVALAVPVLPLGNVSLGLALLYVPLAVGWLALGWREPRGALLAALGPLLGPLGALGLLPLACLGVRSPARRALQAGTGVLLAALAAGLRHATLPFGTGPPPLGLGIAGSTGPLDVAGSLARSVGAHHALVAEAAALALVAALLPLLLRRGRWGLAGAAALLLCAALLAAPGASALPLVGAAWITWTTLALSRRAAT